MNKLSIILSGDEKQIYSYIKSLESILDICDYQLIIVSNTIENIDTKYEYVIYNYTESYRNFKSFCLSLCKYNKALILEKGIELNKPIIDDIKAYIEEENNENLQCDFKIYINDDKFFLNRGTLIYNTNSNKNKVLNSILNDYSLLFEADKDIETSVYKLISYKKYKELYKWSETFSDDVKIKIYKYIEREKLYLSLEEIKYLEEEALKYDLNKKYNNYLKIKKLYSNGGEILKEDIINAVKESKFSSKDSYFAMFLLETFNKGALTVDVLSLFHTDERTAYLRYLFEIDEKFYLKVYNFMINIDLFKELNKSNDKSIEVYFDIIKTYINCMSGKSEEVEKKKKLIQMFTDYSNCGLYLLERNLIKGEEAAFLTEISKAASKLDYDVKGAIKILKSCSEKFDFMTLSTRYYIQQLIYENELYTSKLSICMIVKNEENNIERCLKSLKPLLDKEIAEIILVDTGSTDNTVEIAKKYLEKVYFHPWSGSFSEARNWSISLATGEYIFIVDGDDEIKQEDIDKIIKEFSEDDYKKYNTFSLKVKSYFTEKLDDYSTMVQNHIFKNDGSFYYSGAVHNQPMYKKPIKHLNISLMHYGYIMTPEVSEKKYNRTVPLLKKELEKSFNSIDKSIYYRYQLASSYNMHKDYKEALEEVRIYLKIVKDNWNKIKHNYNITYNVLAVIVYFNNQLYDEALDICNKSLKMIPEYIDFMYFKGNILFIKKNYKESIKCMKQYLEMLDKFDSLDISKDARYVFYTLNSSKEVYLKMINGYYMLNDYKQCIEYINKIQDEEILQKIIYIIFECYFKEKEYKKLIKLYETYITPENYSIFNYYIKTNLKDLSEEDKKILMNNFMNSSVNTEYLNILDKSSLNMIKSEPNKILHLIDKFDIENIDTSGAKIILELILPIIKENNYFKYGSIIELKSFKRCVKFVLNRALNLREFDKFSNEELLSLLDKYLDICVHLITIGNKEALDEKEYRFCKFIIKAFEELQNKKLISAVRLIRDAVKEDSAMARPMQLFIENVIKKYDKNFECFNSNNIDGENNMNNELEKYRNKIKSQIEKLISANDLDEAKKLIQSYEEIIKKDLDICSMKSVILIMEGKLDEAENILINGLKNDNENFDLNYNLGYVYECKKNFDNSIRYYYLALKNCYDNEVKKQIETNIQDIAKKNNIDLNKFTIKKVLFVQNIPCIRTNKVAKAIKEKGIQTDIVYLGAHPAQVYKDIKLPYTNIYKLDDVNEMIEFINKSDYDIIYSSNEPDYLTVLFMSTNKPIVHDTHDMMSLRADISVEQQVLEYIANVKSNGNIYVIPEIRDIAIKKFNIKNKPIFTLNSFIEKDLLPIKFLDKLSSIDGEIHCVFEGGLASEYGHHRYLEPIFLKLAESNIHVHLHCPVDPEYIKQLVKKSRYIHYEGVMSPKDLIIEMTKYDVGLAIFNLNERNNTFLNTAFPNKIWDYLAAGLPIAFADLLSFRQFAEQTGVGKVLDIHKDIKNQIQEIKNIDIEKDILVKNKWLMNEVADDIISFLAEVKKIHMQNRQEVYKELSNDNPTIYDEIYKTGGYD